jgi:hypothetical protein
MRQGVVLHELGDDGCIVRFCDSHIILRLSTHQVDHRLGGTLHIGIDRLAEY